MGEKVEKRDKGPPQPVWVESRPGRRTFSKAWSSLAAEEAVQVGGIRWGKIIKNWVQHIRAFLAAALCTVVSSVITSDEKSGGHRSGYLLGLRDELMESPVGITREFSGLFAWPFCLFMFLLATNKRLC